ncbi:hypothetical protein [Mesobacillus subterraneus]|nr:hypothetical protein [Mesobacillus subterraneus]
MSELKEMRAVLNELIEGQQRLEIGQAKIQQNLVESLGFYTYKIVEHFDIKTDVLNNRVYRLETKIERLSKQ